MGAALERAEQTAEWKAAFLAKHQHAGHGKAPGNKGKGKGKAPIKEAKSASLMDEMQKATGKSPRTAKADCQIAENISLGEPRCQHPAPGTRTTRRPATAKRVATDFYLMDDKGRKLHLNSTLQPVQPWILVDFGRQMISP